MTIDEAMTDLLNTDFWYLQLRVPVSRQYAHAFKNRYKSGQMKHETKLKALLDCGYKISTPLSICR